MASGRLTPLVKCGMMHRVVGAKCTGRLKSAARSLESSSALVSQSRALSGQSQQQQQQQSFIGKLVDNLKNEYERNREMKDSLDKFKMEAEKLEQSEALRSARAKYERLEAETDEVNRALVARARHLRQRLGEAISEAHKLDLVRKATEVTQALNKRAEAVREQGERLGQSAAVKNLQHTARVVQQELDDSTIGTPGVYRAPSKLRMRKRNKSGDNDTSATTTVAADTETTHVELHKDSRFYASWQNFKNNNAYVNKVLDWKMRYDESDNVVARASRLLTEKVGDLMGGMFQRTEMSQVLTEICRMDPSFDRDNFLRQCEHDIIPNVLEAMSRGDRAVLRDWCHEPAFQQLWQPLEEVRRRGLVLDNRVLDVDSVDLAMAKMMDQGPVLVITFTSQQVHCVRDATGAVVDGDAAKVMRVHYVWVLCRDQTELDPTAAWRLLELSASARDQLV